MSLADYSISNPLIINFDSKDRIAGTNSNFISPPQDLGQNQYDSVALIQASIPKSFFNMPSGYNQFRLIENGVSTTITIPAGNYTRINLQSVLSTLLTTASPGSLTYTVTYPASTVADTLRYTYTISTSNVYTIQFVFDSNSPYRQMGFDIGTYTFTPVGGTSQTLVSVNAINLAYILRAYIRSNIVSNANSSILEELLNFGSFPSASVMSFQQTSFDLNSRIYNRNNINSWSFALVDAFSREIDLNGLSWAFSLVLYQRNATHEIHKQELRIINEERLFKIQQEQDRIRKEIQQGQVG